MKFIRQQQKKNVQFSKSEIDFLNNFNNFEQFASFSNAFKNLYNKILNFAEEGEKPQSSSQEDKNADRQTIKNQESREEIKALEDLLDPEYFKSYAALRADSDLGKQSGSRALSKYADRYAKYIVDKFKKSGDDDFDHDPVVERASDLISNNEKVTARNALKKYPSKTMNLDQKRLADQIRDTRNFLIGGKLLPTPENVMDSVRNGGFDKIDWDKPEEVERYQSILDYYNDIYKKNPEDLKALSWNNNQRGNTVHA